MKKFLLLVALFFVTLSSFAHVWEIRVNQNQDGSLTWYMQSYHGLNSCGHANSGININGTNYPLEAEFSGSVEGLSPNIFTSISSFARASYAIVHTPYIAGVLNVTAYSNNACWDGYPGMPLGNQSFTPPPPPTCTSCPVTSWTNTMASTGNNNGTLCNPNDDNTTATIHVNHLACASITGDKQFRIIYDPSGANVVYGPFTYNTGILTDIVINVPYGTSNSTQIQVIDDDFPCQISHGLTIAGGQYLGEKETTPPSITCPGAQTICTTTLPDYRSSAVVSDNCTASNNIVVTQSPAAGSTVSGVVTVTLTATDAAGNQSSCNFAVTAGDTQKPTITCPANQTLNLDASCSATLPDYRSLLTVSDNCTATGSLVITQSPAAGTVVTTKGALVITFTVTDAAGNFNTCTITVDKKDVTAPVINCPASQTVNNNTNVCGAVVSFSTPTATDNCSGSAFNFWNAGEPNNAGGEDYLQLYNSGTWNDLPNGVGNRSIVEFNSVISTVFANYSLIGSFGGHTYYISAGTNTWTGSRTAAQAIGGDLASINTLAEDNFLAPYGGSTWVGGYQDHSDPSYVEPGNASQNFGGWKWVDGTKLGAGQITITQISGLASGSVFPIGVTTNTFRATDESGNASTCSFTVTVIDNQRPTISCPSNITRSSDAGVCTYSFTPATPAASDNCPGVTVAGVRSDALALNAPYPFGTTTITWTAKDASNNTQTCTQTITVTDTEKPVILNLPASFSVNALNNNCSNLIGWTAPTATDNCGMASFTSSDPVYNQLGYTLLSVGVNTITYTATDIHGNVTTASFTVTVVDNQVPIITGCPSDITVNAATGRCDNTASWNAPTASDNCPGVSLTTNHIPGEAFPVGTTLVTYTATDHSGLVTTCSFNVTVIDNQLPAISSASAISVSNDAGICAASVAVVAPAATDNCPGVTVAGVRSDALALNAQYPVGSTTIIWTATDAHNNTASTTQTITVTDNELPKIIAAANQTVTNAPGDCGANVTVVAPATSDNCAVQSVTNSYNGTADASGHFPAGPTTITWTVTDIHGNTNTATQIITVTDNERPTVVCPQAQTLNLDANCSAALPDYRSLVTANDNCTAAGALVITQSPGAGTVVNATGNITVTFTVRDASNNSTNCSITVTKKDVTPPTIVCPQPITVNITPNRCDAVVTYSLPVATDNCAGSATTGVHVLNSGMQFFDYANGTFENQYSPGLPLTFNPTDGQKMAVFLQSCGSTHYMYQNVTIAAGTAQLGFDLQYNNHYSSFSSQQFVTVEIRNASTNALLQTIFKTNPGDPLSKPMTHYSFDVSAYAGQTIRLQIIDATINNFFFDVLLDNVTVTGSNLVNGSFETGDYTGWTIFSSNGSCGTWGIGTGLGVSLTQIAGLASGSSFPIGTTTNTFKATDLAGNTSTCSFNVTVVDNQAPVIACQGNISLIATSASGATVNYTVPVGTDNCSGAVTTLTNGLSSGSTFPIGTTVVTYTVTDAAGLTASCSFNVVVTGLPPVIVVPQNIAGNNDAGQCGAIVSFAATETTAIPASTITYSIQPGSFFPIGTTTVTATATNAVGSSIGTFTVTVTDNTIPVITMNGNKSVNNDATKCGATVVVSATAADNCGVGAPSGVRSDNKPLTDLYPVGTTTITWTVTDIHGNNAIPVTQTIVVTDNEIPVITSNGNKSVNNDLSKCGATVVVSATATDNCGVGAPLGVRNDNKPLTDLYPVGTTTITWTVTDIHTNAAIPVVQTIVVTDNELPVIITNGDKSVNNDATQCGATVTVSASAADNCGVGAPSGVRSDALALSAAYPVGTTTITWTVTDIHGNNALPVVQTIVVTDNTIPVITSNGDKAVNNDATKCGATVVVSATATDNCGVGAPSGVRSDNKPLTDLYPVGTTTITWTVTDIHTNAAIPVVQTIVVTDNEKPTIVSAANQTQTNDFRDCGANVTVVGPATGDNCAVQSVTNSYTGTSNATAHYPVGMTTITWTVTDTHGNTNTSTQKITVVDNENPVITGVPANINVYNDRGVCGAKVNWIAASASDNCPGVVITSNYHSGDLFPVGTTTVTYTATDAYGHTVTSSFTIKVTDNEVPIVRTKPVTVTLVNGVATITAAMVDNNSTDNCGIKTVSVAPSTFYCANIGANTVVLTVTDIYGNQSSNQATVTVVGEIPGCTITSVPTNSTFTGGNPNNLYLGYGAQSTTLKVTPTGVSGNGGPNYTYTYSWSGPAIGMLSSTTSGAPVFTPTQFGYYTFTVVTTNNYGCSTTCTISICVTDIRVPGTNGSKVYVCHLPPGNTGNPQTLSISVNAVPAHLGNHTGDRLGSCNQAPCGAVVVAGASTANTATVVKGEEVATTEEELKVTVMPNPTTTYFTLKLESKYATPVNMRVMDANGRVIDAKSQIGSNSTIQIGHNYSSGTYYAEMIQGTKRKVVQLIKAKG